MRKNGFRGQKLGNNNTRTLRHDGHSANSIVTAYEQEMNRNDQNR